MGLSVGDRCWKREAVKVGREHILEQVDGLPFKKPRLRLKSYEFLYNLCYIKEFRF